MVVGSGTRESTPSGTSLSLTRAEPGSFGPGSLAHVLSSNLNGSPRSDRSHGDLGRTAPNPAREWR